jgi:hypothetical protein
VRKRVPVILAVAATAMIVAACGGPGESTTTSSGGDGGNDAGSITIMSPKDGASVTSPFTLKFDAGDIGPTDSGKDHVHIFVDDEETDYTVVTENTFQIEGLVEGEHTLHVTKQHADHSPTGAEAEVKVNVTGGDTSGGSSGGGGEEPDYGY